MDKKVEIPEMVSTNDCYSTTCFVFLASISFILGWNVFGKQKALPEDTVLCTVVVVAYPAYYHGATVMSSMRTSSNLVLPVDVTHPGTR